MEFHSEGEEVTMLGKLVKENEVGSIQVIIVNTTNKMAQVSPKRALGRVVNVKNRDRYEKEEKIRTKISLPNQWR